MSCLHALSTELLHGRDDSQERIQKPRAALAQAGKTRRSNIQLIWCKCYS